MSWIYKGIPLKDYLANIIKDKSELNYLYSTVRKILAKEYIAGTDLDTLITDVLKRDKIQKIINGDYVKQRKQVWVYKTVPLKKYLSVLVSNKEDLQFLYQLIKVTLENEYTLGMDLDLLIEDILNRDKIQSIIKGEYVKSTQENWEYKGMPLTVYVDGYIKSLYRSKKQIRENIVSRVTARIKRENLSTCDRERLIEEYINSPRFIKFINSPTKKKQFYFYKKERLYHYLMRVVADKQNVNYIYCFIIGRISKRRNLDQSKDLDSIINDVMASEEVIILINTETLKKAEKEPWPYKNGLLINYLKSIDLNGKKPLIVYLHVKNYLKCKYPNGFQSLEEKKAATEEYIASTEFAKYIKYGFTNKLYFYKGMLLIDYIKLYYEDILKANLKTPDNFYAKILSMLSRYENIDTLSLEEIEELIDHILGSDEIKMYLNKKKTIYEVWTYNGRNLKDVISEVFSDIIEDDFDLYRIYAFITRNARKLKLENKERSNNDIISSLLSEEFVLAYKAEYIRRKEIRKEVKEKTALYDNKDDFGYICCYAQNKNLDMNEIMKICKQGFNYYSAIIILEYSLKFGTPVKELIDFTLNNTEIDDIYLLWLFKLGFKDYIADVIERNKRLINQWIYKGMLIVFNEANPKDFEDVQSILYELLIAKHISISVSIDYLFISFKAFVQSCIKRIFLDMRSKRNAFVVIDNLDNEDFHIQISSTDNVEDGYINNEDDAIINNAIRELDQIEQDFIDLRYGFSSHQHSLQEIKKLFASKGIFMSLIELEQMDKDILNKLKNNPNILTLSRHGA